MNIGVLVRAARPPFLLLTPVCVLLGAATAAAAGNRIDWLLTAMIVAAALAAHISVNALNEYADFRSGLDLQTRRTAFSGGSGALPAAPECARQVLVFGLLMLALTAAAGIWFVYLRGLYLLPLGLAGLALVVCYTPWINRRPWLCLLAPGLGFGVFMVVGSAFVIGGEYTWLAGSAALIPFALVNNVLLLNQYPDIEADRYAGRRHIAIMYGTGAANTCYLLFMLLAAGTLLGGIAFGYLPTAAGLALPPLALSLYAWFGARRYGPQIGEQPRYLAANVAAAMLTPAILAAALFVA